MPCPLACVWVLETLELGGSAAVSSAGERRQQRGSGQAGSMWIGPHSHLLFPRKSQRGMLDGAAKHCFSSNSAWRVQSWVKGSGQKRGPVALGLEVCMGSPGGWGKSLTTAVWHSSSTERASTGPGHGGAGPTCSRCDGQTPRSQHSPGLPGEGGVGGHGLGEARGSGSQQEACPRPLEPQEGHQAPGEGGRERVDELL